MKSNKIVIVIGVLLFIAMVSLAFFGYKYNSNTQNATQQVQVTDDTKQLIEEPVVIEGVDSSNTDKLMDVIKKYPGYVVGVSVASVTSDDEYSINGDVAFTAASTTKAIVATYTYDQADKGHIHLDSNLGDTSTTFSKHLNAMIVYSDNESWKDLLNYFGYSNIQKYVNQLGYDTFNATDNEISSGDMAGFLKDLQKTPLISPTSLASLNSLMSRSLTGPLILQPEYKSLVKKAGWLEDRLNFVGIIEKDDKKAAFGIFTETTGGQYYDYTNGTDMINELLGVIKTNL